MQIISALSSYWPPADDEIVVFFTYNESQLDMTGRHAISKPIMKMSPGGIESKENTSERSSLPTTKYSWATDKHSTGASWAGRLIVEAISSFLK